MFDNYVPNNLSRKKYKGTKILSYTEMSGLASIFLRKMSV